MAVLGGEDGMTETIIHSENKMKQLSNDITSSGTVRINTLMLLLLPVLPQLGITLTPEIATLGAGLLNVGWKIFQKWLNKVNSE